VDSEATGLTQIPNNSAASARVFKAWSVVCAKPVPGSPACPYNGETLSHQIAIVAGTGAGQIRQIVEYQPASSAATTTDTSRVDQPWQITPDTTSHYAVLAGDTRTMLIKDNTFTDAGESLDVVYCGGRDIAVVGNQVNDSGPIWIRSFQNMSTYRFNASWDVILDSNVVESTASDPYYLDCTVDTCNSTRHIQTVSGLLNDVNLNGSEPSFGLLAVGVEMRRNRIVAAPLLLESPYDYNQGYNDSVKGSPGALPAVLGTVFDSNAASYYIDGGLGFGSNLHYDSEYVDPSTSYNDFAYWTFGDPEAALFHPISSESVNDECGAIRIGHLLDTTVPTAEQTQRMTAATECALFDPPSP
jgi:hypothetical protein